MYSLNYGNVWQVIQLYCYGMDMPRVITCTLLCPLSGTLCEARFMMKL